MGNVNGEAQIITPCKIYTSWIFKIKLCPRNYLMDIYPREKVHSNNFRGACRKRVKYYAFVMFLLSCPVLVILFFRNRTQLKPLDRF